MVNKITKLLKEKENSFSSTESSFIEVQKDFLIFGGPSTTFLMNLSEKRVL